MTNQAFLRSAAVGLLGSVVLGVLLRDVLWMAIGMAVVGVLAGLVSSGRSGIAGLWIGQLASFLVLWIIQFGTTINTFINTESVGEIAGVWPIVLAMWLGFLAVAAVALALVGRVASMRRLP